MASGPTTNALDGRIKFLGSSARTGGCVLEPANACNPRYVYTGGHVSSSNALNSNGAAPLVLSSESFNSPRQGAVVKDGR